MKILLYGCLADANGPEMQVDLPPGTSVADVRQRLSEAHPSLREALRRSRTVVAERIVADDYRMADNEDIEFLPMVSGG